MLIGHKKQWSSLQRAIKNNRVSHAYLFYGPAKIGKKEFALEFAKLLNNTTGDSHINPDFILLEPIQPKDKEGQAKKGSRSIISIAQISDLKSRLSLSAINDGYKVAIIDKAPKMTFDAQGTLLKLLEEPKGKTIIILLAQHPGELFSTIVSRCQAIRFDLLSEEEIEKSLSRRGVEDKKAKELSWLSFGRPELAFNYLNNPEEEKLQKEKIESINSLLEAPLHIRFQYAERLSKQRDETFKTLDIWLNYLRKILLSKIEKRTLPFFPIKERFSINDLKEKINLIEKIKLVLSHTNANSRLALEILLMKI